MIGKRSQAHREADVAHLQCAAINLPLLVRDTGHAYAVYLAGSTALAAPLVVARHEVVAAFIAGWRHAEEHYTREGGEEMKC